MGYKTKILDDLKSKKINIHEYKEVHTKDELVEYSKNNKYFSIRFDKKEKIQDLPFYYVDNNNINFDEIIDRANELNASLLLSNGRSYDKYLLFNFVIEIDNDYNFILELCDKKVPLRNMYEYKTTVITGNLMDKYNTYQIINKNENKFISSDIETIINFCLNHKYKYIEGSIYNKEVGIYNDKLVIWQTN